VTNGSTYNGTSSREYDIIKLSPGYFFSQGDPFGGFNYSGTDALPLSGSQPWNHGLRTLGTTPQTFYYELTH
jgi:hypothetical protein